MFYFKLLTGRKCSADEWNDASPESVENVVTMEEVMLYFKLLSGRKCSADELNYEVPEGISGKEMNTERRSYVFPEAVD
jgi:hypothetical protein